MQIVYDIRDLAKIYPSQPQPANQDICLQIYAGEIFGLLGDNGAGKTTLDEAYSASMLLTFIMLGLGPVVIPPERLPMLVRQAGWLSPATYASSALRQTLLGPVTPRLGLDLGMLALISLGTFWLVSR
jgi:ABC-type multidrug transport system permease subunit